MGEKTNYAVHCINLQLHLSLRMKLTKIYKVLKFKQSDWMKIYVSFSNTKRIKTTISFEKNFFKFMVNSVYGKAMGNLRKRVSVRVVKGERII